MIQTSTSIHVYSFILTAIHATPLTHLVYIPLVINLSSMIVIVNCIIIYKLNIMTITLQLYMCIHKTCHKTHNLRVILCDEGFNPEDEGLLSGKINSTSSSSFEQPKILTGNFL